MDFQSLFQRLYPSLYRYLHRLTGDPDAADEVAQEAFTRLLRQGIPEEEVRPWLFTVATNLVRDQARTSARRERLLAGAPVTPSAFAAPDEEVERQERIERVRAALGRLSPRDRTILLMREEGFTYGEIAEAIGVAATSVGTLAARAVRRFTEAYAAEDDGDGSYE